MGAAADLRKTFVTLATANERRTSWREWTAIQQLFCMDHDRISKIYVFCTEWPDSTVTSGADEQATSLEVSSSIASKILGQIITRRSVNVLTSFLSGSV